jgi:hypothetical protein
MTPAIIVALLIIVPTLAALHPDGRLISHTPYNDRHSDATGARENHPD